jgi:hypothetical protein
MSGELDCYEKSHGGQFRGRLEIYHGVIWRCLVRSCLGSRAAARGRHPTNLLHVTVYPYSYVLDQSISGPPTCVDWRAYAA